jgi:D-lactate dehydrogenase (cytochrome)
MRSILGKDAIREAAPELLFDESRFTLGVPQAAFFPTTHAEVGELLARASAQKIPVTIIGGQTGITGGSVPVEDCYALCLSEMNRIRRFQVEDDARAILWCEAGITLSSIHAFLTDPSSLDTHGADTHLVTPGRWFYPPDPTEWNAQLGGTVSTNASGARSFHYGPTRSHVEGLSLVLANGDSVTLQRGQYRSDGRGFAILTEQGHRVEIPAMSFRTPDVKNASGYYSSEDMDLVDLFIGAEGTLGVVTDVGIRLTPHVEWVSGLSFLPHRNEALDLAQFLRSEPGVVAIEYFDVTSLDLIQANKASLSLKLPDFPEGMRTALYWEVLLETDGALEEKMSRLEKQLNRHGSSLDMTWSGHDFDQSTRLRSFRHAVPETVNHMIATAKSRSPEIRKIGTDTALPGDVFERTFHEYIRLIEGQGLAYAAFGHLGDHHIHFNLLPRNKTEFQSGLNLYDQMMDLAIQRAGSVSAEHGIGKMKTTYLAKMVGADALDQMKRVKTALDPDWLLNRGNLFDSSSTETGERF